MAKKQAKPRSVSYRPSIRYMGKGPMRPEFREIIDRLCGKPWSLERRRIRIKEGDSLHQTLARYVCQEFEALAESYRVDLDTRSFEITVEVDEA